MIFRDRKIIFYIIFLLLINFSIDLSAEITDEDTGRVSNLVSEILYFSSTRELSVDSVKNIPEDSFQKRTDYIIKPDEIVWLKITLDNRFAEEDEYIIHFYNHFHEIYLYQENSNNEWIERRSGIMMPEKFKKAKGFIKDKVPFTISDKNKTVIYLKIKNQLEKYLDISKIRIVSSKLFSHTLVQTKQIQSFFLGVVFILCFFNLLLFIFTKTRIYLYYLLYAATSSLYFIHYFRYFESGFFVNHPEINIYFFFSSTVIQAIYCWFLYESVKKEVVKTTLDYIKKYALLVSAGTLIILIIAVFNFFKGVQLSDIFSIINSICIITFVFLLYRQVSKTVKIILTGSLFLIAGAFLAIVFNLKNELPVYIYFFQSGLFIELIFFTIAINFIYQDERLAKLKSELKNSILVNEKLTKEREAQKLREQVQLKERDLAAKAVAISQKETLIKNVTSLLEKQVNTNSVKIKDIKGIVSDLNSKTDNNFWEEFETYFIKVHPEFYSSLNRLYPGLTTNERRLCAFIKLNLTTKEIANITKRNPESIHMTRSRLRKKMGLDKSENLENILSTIR